MAIIRFSYIIVRVLIRAFAKLRYIKALRKSYRNRDNLIGINLTLISYTEKDKKKVTIQVYLLSRALITSLLFQTLNNFF